MRGDISDDDERGQQLEPTLRLSQWQAARGAETPPARRARRLARLRELGGDMRRAGEAWQVTGQRGALAELIREEAAAGRPRADKTDVRDDLAAAMGEQRGS